MTLADLQNEMIMDLHVNFTSKKYKYYKTRKKAARREIWRIALITLERLGMPDPKWLKGFENVVIDRFQGEAMYRMYPEG